MSEGIGIRNVIFDGASSTFGHLYVEDVETDAKSTHRQTYAESSSEQPIASARIVNSKCSSALLLSPLAFNQTEA